MPFKRAEITARVWKEALFQDKGIFHSVFETFQVDTLSLLQNKEQTRRMFDDFITYWPKQTAQFWSLILPRLQ